MKKILYLTNIEVPYRVRFFNELAKHCDLTVLYEREHSSNRNSAWAKSEKQNYRSIFLNGIRIRGESTFSLKILKHIFSGYDSIIVGCYNSPVQLLAILVMRLFRIPYMVNLDGEPFLEGTRLKTKLKLFFLKGAGKYLVAGEKACDTLQRFLGPVDAVPYYFSSLSEKEVYFNAEHARQNSRSNTVLVVAQYVQCKGLDLALRTAQLDTSICYIFVGMGGRTENFLQDFTGQIPENVQIVPFLQKEELEKEYRSCALLLLPSRQECWGLVINEAASFGTPIVSTWGSGAAVEFLGEKYPEYLAAPGDPVQLYERIRRLLASEDRSQYRDYLLSVSKAYTIERSVQMHCKALELV